MTGAFESVFRGMYIHFVFVYASENENTHRTLGYAYIEKNLILYVNV